MQFISQQAVFSFCFFFPRNKALCTFILKCSSKRRKISQGPLYLQCQRGKGIRRILNSCWLKNAPLAGLTIGAQRKGCLQYLHRLLIFVQCEVYVEIILTLSQKEKKQADPSVGAKPNQQEIFVSIAVVDRLYSEIKLNFSSPFRFCFSM